MSGAPTPAAPGTPTPPTPTSAPPPAAAQPPAPAPAPTPIPADPPAPAQEPDWKAEARKWEDRAKANKAAAEELERIKAEKMTDEQKAAKALADAQAELAQYKTREQVATWSAEIVQGSSVPASALRGSTREELEAHFEELKALITPQPPAAQPVPTVTQTPPTPPGNVPLRDQIAAAEKAGNFELAGQLKAMQLGSVSP
ncbi:hypothetical protein JN535_04220 [Cellulosimicrobium cellulans]|uniref:hypothetical protein n=1 Tax=Cellulosimicrobium cellulans TaxID=1710 RepID=UPI001965B267|nr:hypothetical protein [Cellulosimicrobium cellulans]MBN0039380.1 hypothetical protein [Cellulosimicrobium cellulans]